MKRNALLVLLFTLLLLACGEEKKTDDQVGLDAMQCNLSSQTYCPATGQCVYTETDPTNCGGCGIQCPQQPQQQACVFGSCSACGANALDCGAGCQDVLNNSAQCGGCGIVCGPGQTCQNGACKCGVGYELCNGACTPVMGDPANCGGCGQACQVGQVCSGGMCAVGCAASEKNCNGFCINTTTDSLNCGDCGMMCSQGQTCSGGFCGCPSGQIECNGVCVDTRSNTTHCGTCNNACAAGASCNVVGNVPSCQCPPGQMPCNGACALSCDTPSVSPTTPPSPTDPGPAPTGPDGSGGMSNMPGPGPGPDMTENPVTVPTPEGRSCPVTEGLIADFEEGSAAVLAIEGRIGLFEGYNDGAGTQTTSIVDEGTDACNKGVLRTQGSGFSSYVGLGTVFTGTWDAANEEYIPTEYDAESRGYVGISFRAKQGSGQQYPVRVSLATKATSGTPHGDGSCLDNPDADNGCWNHMGHFLIDDEALTTSWKTFTLCFDRDLYPMWLPTHLTVEQRNNIGKGLMNLNFQFNQGYDQQTATDHPRSGSFDFYVDDVRLVKSGCDETVFPSTGGATDAFGTNAAVGSCEPVPNAAKFNTAIAQAYARWRRTFVVSDGGGLKVVAPEMNNRTVSEGMGYGMLIAAAMGDKETFDGMWSWTRSRLTNGLLGWDNGSGGSATDADTDIAYALLMAAKQWGGSYASDGNAMADTARQRDVANNIVVAGENYQNRFNPSYFSPGFYRAFSGWDPIISATRGLFNQCDSNFSGADGILPDWCSLGGSPEGAGDAGVQSEVCPSSAPCSAYDASRVPWRMAYDACMGDATSRTMATTITNTYAGKYPAGRIDLLQAGFNAQGQNTSTAVRNEMAFIGTVGTAAQAANNAVVRDRAFRTTLDIIERPEYYKTYYSTSLGLLTLLMMSGNWPVP